MMIRDLDDIDRELSGDDEVTRKKLWQRVFSNLGAFSEDEWQTVASTSREALRHVAKRRARLQTRPPAPTHNQRVRNLAVSPDPVRFRTQFGLRKREEDRGSE